MYCYCEVIFRSWVLKGRGDSCYFLVSIALPSLLSKILFPFVWWFRISLCRWKTKRKFWNFQSKFQKHLIEYYWKKHESPLLFLKLLPIMQGKDPSSWTYIVAIYIHLPAFSHSSYISCSSIQYISTLNPRYPELKFQSIVQGHYLNEG